VVGIIQSPNEGKDYTWYRSVFFTANWVNYMLPSPIFYNLKNPLISGFRQFLNFTCFLKKLLTRNGWLEFFLFFPFLFAFLVQVCRFVPQTFSETIRTQMVRIYGYTYWGSRVWRLDSGPNLQPCSLGCCYTIPFFVLKRILMIRNHEVTWKKVNR